MVKVRDINRQNPWWSQGGEFAGYDKSLSRARPVFFNRKRLAPVKERIYILRGPRQVGKTTYLKNHVRHLIETGVAPRDILYLSLDFFLSRREFRNAIQYFLDSRREAGHLHILLDEITFLDDWNLELKYMADRGILQKATLLATGSSAVKLKEKGELLPGRGLEGNEHYLKPLGFREYAIQSVDYICRHLDQDEFSRTLMNLKPVLASCAAGLGDDMSDFAETVRQVLPFKEAIAYLFRLYLMSGGLPGVVNHYLSNRFQHGREWIDPAVAEVFVRDVMGDMARLQKQETITRQLFRGIMARYGTRFSFSKLSREIERSHLTTIDYLRYMEDSFICFVLYAYDFNKKSHKAKGDKKVYFFDPFVFSSIQSFVTGRPIQDVIDGLIENEDLLGKIVEGIVVSHLRRHGEIPLMRAGNTFLWFYYDRSGREIDAVITDGKAYYGCEVKYRETASRGGVKRGVPLAKSFILSKEDFEHNERMMIVPADVFLLLLTVSDRNL